MFFSFGFGSPLMSILMMIVTGLISYFMFRALNGRAGRRKPTRAELRNYYYEQRIRVREESRHFNLSDEEIERRIDEELGPNSR